MANRREGTAEQDIVERGVQGWVKWFDGGKGYGFVARKGHPDIFVHYTGIAGDGYRELQPDQKVEFDVVKEEGRLKAVNVVVVGQA